MIFVLLLLVCCLIGAGMFYWLWTVDDFVTAHGIPWSPEEPVDFGEYPLVSGHDWTGLA